MGVEQEFKGEFPIGMRVLAVDDDRVCLKFIGELLRKCKYNVTTTPHATTALKLLRENPDHFDLMISDVHMPDMDGFKLLELVGLEMDIPVIMLSANDETKAVMKGINHGARDYLLKPVRIEELKNIWQHVIRKNIKSKESGSSGQGDLMILPNLASNGQTEGSPKPSRKHRDHDEVDEEADDHSNDESSSQKKQRVVWTKQLHQLFLDAVRSLGDEEKAVPKRILERMNVPWLTRENVASHLQKYRIYLKKHLRSDVTQQCNFDSSIQHVNHSSSYMRQSSFLNQQIPGIGFPSFGTHCPNRGNYVGNPGSSVIHFNQVHNYNFDINFGAPFPTSPAEQTGLLRIQNLPADVKVENKTASPIEDSLNALTMNNVNQIPNVLPAKQNPFQNSFLSSNTGSLRTSSLVPRHDIPSGNLQNGISLLGCSSRQNSVAVQSDASYPGSVQDSSRTLPLKYVDSSVLGSNPTAAPSFDLATGSKLAIDPGSESEGAAMSYGNILPKKTVPVLCASEAVDLHPMQDTVPELGFHNQTSDSLFDVDTAESFMHESIFPLLHHQAQDLANCGISSWDLDDSANGGGFMLNHDVNEFRTGMVGRTRSSSLDVLESQRSSPLDNSSFGDGLLSTVVKQKYGVGSWK